MVEIERNPLAVRQGAATIVCIAAAAVAMPVIAHRAAEQRDGAEWAATSTAFQAELQQQMLTANDPNARVELVAYRTADGLRARGAGSLFESANTHALLIEAALRSPRAAHGAAAPAEAELNPAQLNCLSQAVYYEARGEGYKGQVAVAEVVMNRSRSRYYPHSVCGVVYQGSHLSTGCQFTFTCDGSLNQRPRGRAWTMAQRISELVMKGYTRPVTQHATHYHTTAVNPVWSAGLVPTTTIGTHLFYRFPTASERPIYEAALLRRRGRPHLRGEPALDDIIPPVAEDEIVTDDASLVVVPIEEPVAGLDAGIDTMAAAPTPAPATADTAAPPPIQPGEVAT